MFSELWLFIVIRDLMFTPFNYFLLNQPNVKKYHFIYFLLYSVTETMLFKDWHFKLIDYNFIPFISVFLNWEGRDSFVSKGALYKV